MALFDKKIAIVTGGSRGIGAEIVRDLVHLGFTTYFTYVSSEEAASRVVDDLRYVVSYEGREGSAKALRVDQSDMADIEKFTTYVLAREEKVDLLVNNAGITKDKLLALMSDDSWMSVLNTNLNGMFAMTRPIVKSMMRAKSGRIINITSVSGLIGVAGQTNYSTTKAGIIGFTQSLAKETATYNIPVNAVAPGFIDTDMVKGIPAVAFTLQVPMKRMGTVQEVANVVSYLATRAPLYLTGQTIALDGGMTT